MLKNAVAFILFSVLVHCANTDPAPPAAPAQNTDVVAPSGSASSAPADPTPTTAPAPSPDAFVDPTDNVDCGPPANLRSLTVALTGRDAKVDLPENSSSGFTTWIDWREDPERTQVVDQANDHEGVHTYAFPGTYRPLLMHSQWQADTYPSAVGTVVIAGPAAPPELAITGPVDGATIEPDNVRVSWNWSPWKPLAIDIALLDDTGAIIATRGICPSVYLGDGYAVVKTPKAKAKERSSHIQVRIRLWDDHVPVLETKSDARNLDLHVPQ